MRWNKVKYGDTKVKRKFAILPITINDEVRWLEWVTIKYTYTVSKDCIAGWYATEFIGRK